MYLSKHIKSKSNPWDMARISRAHCASVVQELASSSDPGHPLSSPQGPSAFAYSPVPSLESSVTHPATGNMNILEHGGGYGGMGGCRFNPSMNKSQIHAQYTFLKPLRRCFTRLRRSF